MKHSPFTDSLFGFLRWWERATRFSGREGKRSVRFPSRAVLWLDIDVPLLLQIGNPLNGNRMPGGYEARC